MILKSLAFLTLALSLVVFYLLLTFKIPLAYLPKDISQVQFVIIYFVFFILEVFTLVCLFLHMFETSKIDLNYELMKIMKEE